MGYRHPPADYVPNSANGLGEPLSEDLQTKLGVTQADLLNLTTNIPEIAITADTEAEINPEVEAKGKSEGNENAERGKKGHGRQDDQGKTETKYDDEIKAMIDNGASEFSSNTKGKENSQNDSIDPTDRDKVVTEGQFYFKAWPNPQERQGKGKFHDPASP